MTETDVLIMFQNTSVGAAARDWYWLWPTCETLHFVGLCTLFGALLIVDLRVLGVGKRLTTISSVMPFIPVAFAGGLVNLITGVIFFCGYPNRYWSNDAFRWKMALFLFGALNALAFELLERRKLAQLPAGADANLTARAIAAASLLTWVIVISLGRLLPYTGESLG
jgi:hypothetical protein